MCDIADYTARQFGHSGVAASAQMLRLIKRPRRAAKGKPVSNAVKLVKLALAKGINFIDVTDVLEVEGLGSLAQSRCEELVLAVRFGSRQVNGKQVPDSSRDSMRRTCETALENLGVGTIDLFYQELPDPETPIEETAEELKALVASGKINVAGLTPRNGDALRRAHAIQPVAVVPLSWSVWNPQVDHDLVSVCRELGVSVLANKALGTGVRVMKYLDGEAVGKKVKNVLDNYRKRVLKRLQNINEHPATLLEKQMKTIIGAQSENLSEMLTNMLNKQANMLVVKVKKLLEMDTELAGKMENLIALQKERATGKVKALLEKQQDVLAKKAKALVGVPDKFLQRLQKITTHQQHALVTRVTHLRARQGDKLGEHLKRNLEQASPVVKKLTKFLNKQSCNLVAKIYWKKGMQMEHLMNRVKAALAMHVNNTLQKQSSQVSRRIFNILGNHAPLPMCVKKKLDSQTQGLAVKFDTLAAKGVDSERLKVVLDRMMHKHASIVLSEVQTVVHRRNEGAECAAEAVLRRSMAPVKEDGTQVVDESLKPNNEIDKAAKVEQAKKLMAISEGVKAVAKAQRVGFNAVCVAWVYHQGVKAIPVANVFGQGECMDALIKGANIELTEEELGRMREPTIIPTVDKSWSLDLDEWDDCDITDAV